MELKWLDSDEFAHWTSPEAFADSARTRRKRREYQLFTDLAAGRWDDQPGVHRIEAPEGVHVIDHVTRVWLPAAPRPLVDRSVEEPRRRRSMSADIPSREGLAEYDVTWPWHGHPQDRLPPGLTCVFRVRNEARNLPWVLPPMLRGRPARGAGRQPVRRRHRRGRPAGGRRSAAPPTATSGRRYPFAVSRAGAEHRDTPADSVHSLTHFYNWSFSHVRTSYSMKWDGDMVLTPEGVATLADLSWQLEDTEAVVVVPRHPLTVVDERTA